MIPYRCIVEPSLQSFQYKIINRLLNCNENLCKWKIKNSDKCFYCLKVDTIEHHLFECTESKKIWAKLNKWMLNNIEFCFDLTICEVLFGIPITNNDMKLLNFLIIIAKHYINKIKVLEKPLYFIELLSHIRQKVRIMEYIDGSLGGDGMGWLDALLDVL